MKIIFKILILSLFTLFISLQGFAQTCADLFSLEKSLIATQKLSASPDKAFFTSWRDLDPKDLLFLPGAHEALNERVKALTGAEVPAEVFEKRDIHFRPSMALAPKLKAVVVYALNARLDFSTGILLDALKYHASQGTEVVVVLSQLNQKIFSASPFASAQARKQQAFLDVIRAAGNGNNVKALFWGENGSDQSNDASLRHIMTAMHAKAQITIGHDPKDSTYIGGGRNLADNYFLDSASDYSAKPDYIQYHVIDANGKRTQRRESPFFSVSDLDIRVNSHSFAIDAATQLVNLLAVKDRNEVLPYVTDHNVMAQRDSQIYPESGALIRHFISRPKLDNCKLTGCIIGDLRMAKKRIRIITPYVGDMPELLSELVDAANRGVEVELITNIDIKGDDFAPGLVGASNRANLLKLKNALKLKIYGWNYKVPMVHIKILQIDDDYISSHAFNWNRRSFNYDVENGVEIVSSVAVSRFNITFDYTKNVLADPVSELKKPGLLHRIIISLTKNHF